MMFKKFILTAMIRIGWEGKTDKDRQTDLQYPREKEMMRIHRQTVTIFKMRTDDGAGQSDGSGGGGRGQILITFCRQSLCGCEDVRKKRCQ